VTSLRINVKDPEAVQALILYTKDIQTILVEKAVIGFFRQNGTLEIVKLLAEQGVSFDKQPRKRSKSDGNGQESGRKKRTNQPPKCAAAMKVGIFKPE